jgi:hypothetical protein
MMGAGAPVPRALMALVLGASACSGAGKDGPAPGAEPSLTGSSRWGTSGDDFARSLAVAPDGSVLATGYTDGAFEGAENAGSWDAFLSRLEADGSESWSKQWGGESSEFAQAVVVDQAGRAYVAGYSPGSIDQQASIGGHDAFLSGFDANGERAWTQRFGTDADDYVYAAALAPAGVVVVGYTQGAFDGFDNAGGADAFVTLCSPTGEVQWTRQLGTAGTDYAQAVAVDAAGRILVTGYTAGRLGADPDLGAEDAFLLELTSDGELRWLRQWGSDTTDYALSVSADSRGDAYVAGYTYGATTEEEALGGEDAYLTKVAADGTLLWTRQLGTANRDSGRFVTVDAAGAPILGGDTEGSLAAEATGERDAFLAWFDPNGEERGRAQWGSAASEFTLAGAVTGRALYVVGYVEAASARDALLTRWSF